MYDDISQLYHLIYPNWDAAIETQSQAYFDLAQDCLGKTPMRVLDVSCGIGTQSLGLAALGCEVTASDLSEGAVQRAKHEASRRGLKLSLSVADMRQCFSTHGGQFNAVVCADNSLPHLDRAGVIETLENMFRCLEPGGATLIGVRDYKPDEKRGVGQVFPYGTREFESSRYVIFQTRDWYGESYEVGMYFVREMTDDHAAAVICGKSTYHAIYGEDLMQLMAEAGFAGVQRHDDKTHNVVFTGLKPI